MFDIGETTARCRHCRLRDRVATNAARGDVCQIEGCSKGANFQKGQPTARCATHRQRDSRNAIKAIKAAKAAKVVADRVATRATELAKHAEHCPLCRANPSTPVLQLCEDCTLALTRRDPTHVGQRATQDYQPQHDDAYCLQYDIMTVTAGDVIVDVANAAITADDAWLYGRLVGSNPAVQGYYSPAVYTNESSAPPPPPPRPCPRCGSFSHTSRHSGACTFG